MPGNIDFSSFSTDAPSNVSNENGEGGGGDFVSLMQQLFSIASGGNGNTGDVTEQPLQQILGCMDDGSVAGSQANLAQQLVAAVLAASQQGMINGGNTPHIGVIDQYGTAFQQLLLQQQQQQQNGQLTSPTQVTQQQSKRQTEPNQLEQLLHLLNVIFSSIFLQKYVEFADEWRQFSTTKPR